MPLHCRLKESTILRNISLISVIFTIIQQQQLVSGDVEVEWLERSVVFVAQIHLCVVRSSLPLVCLFHNIQTTRSSTVQLR